MMETFCLAMDNYFTFPKVIAALREKDIGVVGTARFRGKNWPPRELRDIKKEDVTFNKFFWMVDEFGTLIARWMDNGLVFLCEYNSQTGTDSEASTKVSTSNHEQQKTCQRSLGRQWYC